MDLSRESAGGSPWAALALGACFAATTAGCGSDPAPDGDQAWTVVAQDLPGALLSIWGTSADDVWVVGADARDGSGPLVLHYDGEGWERRMTGLSEGDLWWVFGFEAGPVYLGGAGGVILRYEDGTFSPMTTPSTGTVFGLWGASPEEMWAVGGSGDRQGFAWRLEGDTWTPEPSVPEERVADAAIWKVYGTDAETAWLVGSNGLCLHWDGHELVEGESGIGSSLFTVHANQERFAAVGGLATGVIVENEGDGWTTAVDSASYGLTGIALSDEGGVAVGRYGSVWTRDSKGWHEADTGLDLDQDLHGVFIDPEGGIWAAGGLTSSTPLVDGVLVHRGDPIQGDGI